MDLRVVREDGLFLGGEVVLQLPAEIGQETADDLLLCLGTGLRQRFDAVAQAGQRLVQVVVVRAMQVFKHVLDAAGTQLAERRAEEGIGIHFTEQQEGVGIHVAIPAQRLDGLLAEAPVKAQAGAERQQVKIALHQLRHFHFPVESHRNDTDCVLQK